MTNTRKLWEIHKLEKSIKEIIKKPKTKPKTKAYYKMQNKIRKIKRYGIKITNTKGKEYKIEKTWKNKIKKLKGD